MVNEPLGEFEAPPDNRGKIWRVDPKLKAKQGELLAQLDGMKKMVRFSPIDALKREVKFKTLAKLTEAAKSGDAKARAHAQQALQNGAYKLGEYTGRDVMLDDEEDDQHERPTTKKYPAGMWTRSTRTTNGIGTAGC